MSIRLILQETRCIGTKEGGCGDRIILQVAVVLEQERRSCMGTRVFTG